MTESVVKHITASLDADHRAERLVVICDAADLVVTLPTANLATKGRRVCVITEVLSGSTGTSVAVQSTDLIQGKGIASPTAGKGAVNTGATDALGDLIEVESDGANVWQVVNVLGTWARQA